jgi:hypothetical protein
MNGSTRQPNTGVHENGTSPSRAFRAFVVNRLLATRPAPAILLPIRRFSVTTRATTTWAMEPVNGGSPESIS